MATGGESDEQINNVVAFPRSPSSGTPVEQFDVVRSAKATTILAAIIRKYGALSITIDDIETSCADRPFIAYQPLTNTWSVSADHPEHGRSTNRAEQQRR